MRNIYAISAAGLLKHIFCCLHRGYTVDLTSGYELVVGIPSQAKARSHFNQHATCILPTRESGDAIGTTAAGYFPAAWGVTATDTTRSALQKVFTATGFYWTDPEL